MSLKLNDEYCHFEDEQNKMKLLSDATRKIVLLSANFGLKIEKQIYEAKFNFQVFLRKVVTHLLG